MTAAARGWTVDEVADALRRSPKTIRNLVHAHQLARQRVRGPRHGAPILLLPRTTVAALRRLVLARPKAPKRPGVKRILDGPT